MISFTLSIIALIIGYFLYGRFVERVFGPDNRTTPAVAKADGVDYMVLPNWRVFMIQFLNIDGTGSIFGAVMGAKFVSKQMLGLPEAVAYPMGIACLIAACVWFAVWYRKESQK